MSLQYSIVFSILIGELSIIALFLIPIPFIIKSSIELALIKTSRSSLVNRIAMAIFVLVFIFFLDSFHKMLKFHTAISELTSYAGPLQTDSSEFGSMNNRNMHRPQSHHHHHNSFQSSALYSTLFYAQRNVYLTGMVLVLFL